MGEYNCWDMEDRTSGVDDNSMDFNADNMHDEDNNIPLTAPFNFKIVLSHTLFLNVIEGGQASDFPVLYGGKTSLP